MRTNPWETTRVWNPLTLNFVGEECTPPHRSDGIQKATPIPPVRGFGAEFSFRFRGPGVGERAPRATPVVRRFVETKQHFPEIYRTTAWPCDGQGLSWLRWFRRDETTTFLRSHCFVETRSSLCCVTVAFSRTIPSI